VDTCWYCGEEIEFRWIDGGPKPIHVSGGWFAHVRSGQRGRIDLIDSRRGADENFTD
jgi:hypothetical protein